MYLQCGRRQQHRGTGLGGLDTSQGRGCGAALGKHAFLLWLSVWPGNKEADQTWAQKATAPLSWNAVAALFKAPSTGGKCGKITCHVYFGKTLLRHGRQTRRGRELSQTVLRAALITLSLTGVFFLFFVFFGLVGRCWGFFCFCLVWFFCFCCSELSLSQTPCNVLCRCPADLQPASSDITD